MAITAKTIIQTGFGPFNVSYHKIDDNEFVSFYYGDVTTGNPIVRIHSACLFGEAFHSSHCDCSHQLTETMRVIVQNGSGVIIYAYDEGRGIGLENKIKAMEIERVEGIDTVEAFKRLGFSEPDLRNFGLEVKVLQDLNVSKIIRSFSSNPRKRRALELADYTIIEELEIPPDKLGALALKEKQTKKDKMGYSYKND